MAELTTILMSVSSTNVVLDDDTINIVRGGELLRAAPLLFKGAKGDTGDKGDNGDKGDKGDTGATGNTGAAGAGFPTGGLTGQVLSKNSNTDFDTHWIDPPTNNSVIDLTSASEDYALEVGETAYIDYTSATSVPLRIAVAGQKYEYSIYSDLDGSTYNAGSITLTPNAGGLSVGAIDYSRIHSQSNTDSESSAGLDAYQTSNSYSKFILGSYLLVSSSGEMITRTKNKHITMSWIGKSSATTYEDYWASKQVWNDTTTAWTSLGTITFPFEQSGRVIIRRLI